MNKLISNCILITINILFLMGCMDRKSKSTLFGTSEVCNNLTREIYVVGAWGALSAETYADYLTDSSDFRVYIGTFSNDENFFYDCSKDSIYIIRLSVIGVEPKKIIDTFKSYSISELKARRIFE